MIDAALAWPNSSIIGFDLVDIGELETDNNAEKQREIPPNVKWKSGNLYVHLFSGPSFAHVLYLS